MIAALRTTEPLILLGLIAVAVLVALVTEVYERAHRSDGTGWRAPGGGRAFR